MTERILTNPNSCAIVIRPMDAEDAPATATFHVAHLATGLLPRLGRLFVRRWHRTFVDSEHGIALVACGADGTVHAFLVGAVDQHAYMQDVLTRHTLPLLWRGALGLMVRPALGTHFLRTRTHRYLRRLCAAWRAPRHAAPPPRRSAGGPQDVVRGGTPVGVVHAVVTRPTCRGRGHARALLARYEELLTQTGTPLAQLITRCDGGALEFYRRLGWRETDRRLDRDGCPIVQLDRVPGAR